MQGEKEKGRKKGDRGKGEQGEGRRGKEERRDSAKGGIQDWGGEMWGKRGFEVIRGVVRREGEREMLERWEEEGSGRKVRRWYM